MLFNTSSLYYGDNLEILRRFVPNESIDLVYLDPPFNSQVDYNILFKESTGEKSTAQFRAFSDFWRWDMEVSRAYEEVAGRTFNETVSKLAQALYDFLGKSNMLAYLAMMGIRSFELYRVLKPTGSIFLH